MTNQFEDYLSELQAEMVRISLEYVEESADDIYIYCSSELNTYTFNVFFNINNNLVHKSELNQASDYQYDISVDRQRSLLKTGVAKLKQIHQACQKFNRDMPTEIKLHYNVEENKLDENYKYEPVYSQYEHMHPDEIFEQWFDEVKKEVEGEEPRLLTETETGQVTLDKEQNLAANTPELDHLISQLKDVNLQEYSRVAEQWIQAIKEGKEVAVDMKMSYIEENPQQPSFDVDYRINGRRYFQRIVN